MRTFYENKFLRKKSKADETSAQEKTKENKEKASHPQTKRRNSVVRTNKTSSSKKSGSTSQSVRKAALVDPQSHIAEKLRLEQAIAGIVGGKTGLLMYLDVLLHDAEEKNYNSFQFHAENYLQKVIKLEKVIGQYEKLSPQEQRLEWYRKFLTVGKNLKELTDYFYNKTLTGEHLECWRKDTLQQIQIYEEGEDV